MSIKLRLLLTVSGLLAALIIILDGFINNARTSDVVIDNQTSLTTLRNHLEADMMHDALRADVFSALLVGLGKSPSKASEVRDSLAEHAEHLRSVVAANQQFPSIRASRPRWSRSSPAWRRISRPPNRLSVKACKTRHWGKATCPPSTRPSSNWKVTCRR